MKLLSDFDGVWTYPDEEGAAHGAALDAALEAALGEGQGPAVRAWVARARSIIRSEPARWGWSSAGRISAFADEDPFTEHGALLFFLDQARGSDPLAAALAAAVEERDGSLDAFGGRVHVGGVREVEGRRGPGITASAAAAGRELLARGVQVVVVSNSGTEKLQRWFEHAGVPNTVHPERTPGALRLRGSARKFVLAPGAGEQIEVGELRVDVARPHYEEVLRVERPDAVVGDVFSLDLALPLALKRRDPAWRQVRLFWLSHPYSSQPMRRALEGLPAGDVEIVDGGLAGVAERLAETA